MSVDAGATDAQNIAGLESLLRRVRAMRNPVTNPTDLVVPIDPETGETIPVTSLTPSGIKCTYRVVTRGLVRKHGWPFRRKQFLDWEDDEKISLIRATLIEPDLVGMAKEDVVEFSEWCDTRLDWFTLEEIGTEICVGSRFDYRLPTVRKPGDDDPGKASGRPLSSPKQSPTDGSTTSDTPTEDQEASTV